jgi:hypothetical protein
VNGIRSNDMTLAESSGLTVTLSQSFALLEPSTVTRVRFFAASELVKVNEASVSLGG